MENKALVEEQNKNANIDNYKIDIHFARKDEGNISTLRRVIAFVIGLIGLVAISIIVQIIVLGFVSDKNSITAFTTFGTYGVLFIVFVLFFLKDFKQFFKQFLDIDVILRGVLIGVFLMGIPSVYLSFVNLFMDFGINSNEASIREMAVQYPLLIIIFAGLLGPICEEFTYRVGFFGAIKKQNKVVAYIVTAIIFGLIHFDFETFANAEKLIIELVNLPAYMISGVILCYAFDRYGFAAACVAHIFNNVVGLLGDII